MIQVSGTYGVYPVVVGLAGGNDGSASSAVMSPQPVMAEGSGLTEEEEAEVRTHNVKITHEIWHML